MRIRYRNPRFLLEPAGLLGAVRRLLPLPRDSDEFGLDFKVVAGHPFQSVHVERLQFLALRTGQVGGDVRRPVNLYQRLVLVEFAVLWVADAVPYEVACPSGDAVEWLHFLRLRRSACAS